MPLGVVNVGPMKCSKTTIGVWAANKLLETVADARVVFVKSHRDTRDSDHRGSDEQIPVRARNGAELHIQATLVVDEDDVYRVGRNAQLLIVDEGQMLRPALASVLLRLAVDHNVHVMYFGLDTTWRGQQFATTAAVCSLPGFKVYKHKSHCELCEEPVATATWSQKLRNGHPVNVLDRDEPTFEIGDSQYRPLCLKHWFLNTPGAHEALALGLIGMIDPETEWRELKA